MEHCVMMTTNGFWRDSNCWRDYQAVCYDETHPSMFVVVKDYLNWFQARNRCRANNTDLVNVSNMTQNDHIASMLSAGAWIGLYRRPWSHWSDQNPRTFTRWQWGQPNNSGGKNMTSCAAVNTTKRTWFDVDCKQKHDFICQNVTYPPPIGKTTVKLRFQSKANLNDPIIQQQILQQLHAKLETQGIPDFKLRWVSTDGQTFHKDQEKKKEGS
ncbi:macrophage mannose receptor 1-like [Parambassis ranga]|uniref:Macrophage mannose receptor 1-like n=1 Tax=Parambassis ranga TaxID=210632 RepID=A0A6P7HK23_9TELE|nr:macrophage mannose receptor 1-like [Parambassis ranga]